MEKHKILEKRLREKTNPEVPSDIRVVDSDGCPAGKVVVYVYTLTYGNAEFLLKVPKGEDAWLKLEEKVLKLIAVLKE